MLTWGPKVWLWMPAKSLLGGLAFSLGDTGHRWVMRSACELKAQHTTRFWGDVVEPAPCWAIKTVWGDIFFERDASSSLLLISLVVNWCWRTAWQQGWGQVWLWLGILDKDAYCGPEMTKELFTPVRWYQFHFLTPLYSCYSTPSATCSDTAFLNIPYN